jgi:SAM-dependent methyltransferase
VSDHAAFRPDRAVFNPDRAHRLNDVRRLESQVSEVDLARLLDLRGHEDLLDLGSGTGFYTDLMAALTTGTVYAVELQPEMNEHYRRRGIPANVRLIVGDLTDLADPSLESASVDVAGSIATWHEIGGRLDLPRLVEILRPDGRLVVIDWRKDPESWESGPPQGIRFTKEEVAASLAPYLPIVQTENLGRFMFAVVARREGQPL